jgi:parvulin-like peptidyl-prolyl isomerase
VRSFVDGIKAQNNFTSDGDLERALKGSLGIGLQEYLVRTKQEMIKQEVLRREVFSKIAVDEPELMAYYQEHLADYRQPIRFRVKELVLPKGADDQEKADTQAKLATIRQELAKGTPFDELVKTYSTAPSRSTGGDLGWLSKGVLRMDLEETVLALKPGEISAPVETDKDIYVVQLMEAELDNTKPFAEVRASILEKLQEPRAQSAIESYIQSLRIRANIRYLVPEATILKG